MVFDKVALLLPTVVFPRYFHFKWPSFSNTFRNSTTTPVSVHAPQQDLAAYIAATVTCVHFPKRLNFINFYFFEVFIQVTSSGEALTENDQIEQELCDTFFRAWKSNTVADQKMQTQRRRERGS